MAQRNNYTATASQTVFDFTFKVFETDEVKVYQNGTLLTETTDYTVAIDSPAPNQGTITLVTGATAGDAIALVQAISATRLITYITAGDWKAATVNSDFDRIYVLLETIMGTSADPDSQISDRLLRFSQSEDRSGKTNAIPTPQEGRYLTWSSGELANSTAPSVTVTEDFALVSNVAALSALASGESMAYTLGKTSEGDGGHGFWYHSSGNAETPDGVSVVAHASSGNWIRLNFGYNSIFTAVAGGTADAITVTTAPLAGVTNDSTRLFVVENSAGANTVANPTITINSLTSLTLKDSTSGSLAIGATGPAGYKMIVAVNNAGTAAILLNPYVIKVTQVANIPTFASLNDVTGLKCTNGTDTDHDIDVSAGAIWETNLAYKMQLTSAITKQIDATWSEGSAAGGLSDDDTLANNTWYGIWLLGKSTDADACDVIFSTTKARSLSDAAATSAGYDISRLIGAVLTDGSANIINTVNDGNGFNAWITPRTEISVSAGSTGIPTTSTDLTADCPPKMIARLGLKVLVVSTSAEYATMMALNKSQTFPTLGNALSDVYTEIQAPGGVTERGYDSAIKDIKTNASSQIKYIGARTSTLGSGYSIINYGWAMDYSETDFV